MSEEQLLTVSEDDNGQRLDRWLKKHMSFALAQKLIRKGAIRIDGKKVKQDTKLVAGQEVRLPPMEDNKPVSRTKPEKKGVNAENAAFIRSLVIYKDEDVIALNKPAGLAVQGGTGTTRHIDGMLDALVNRTGVRPRIVHRLDKDTSGVLLLARSAEAARELGHLFKGRDVKKIYWAITTPAPEQSEGTITAPLVKAGGGHKERIVVDDKEGKSARTDFIVLDKLGNQAAFVAFWPRTGRTHQIRVHAADVLGCPVLGDGKYGGSAARIEGMEDLPEMLQESWKTLGFSTSAKVDPFL